jgi:hypothetical protein
LIVSATGVRVLLNANFNGLDDYQIINYSNSAFGISASDHKFINTSLEKRFISHKKSKKNTVITYSSA